MSTRTKPIPELTEADIRRFWSKVSRSSESDGCWIWSATARNKDGYGYFGITRDKRKLTLHAHRVAYTLAHGQITDRMHVCHHCDVPACVRPEHLFLGTHADNVHDMCAKGRQTRGEHQNKARLTEKQVREILELLATGLRVCVVAEMFGVTDATISNIKNGRCWAWLTAEEPASEPKAA